MNRPIVKAYNFATEQLFNFSPSYRFGVDPKFVSVPPFMTTEDAFDKIDVLKNAPVGSLIYIEWPLDRFCVMDAATGAMVPGRTVWRMAKVTEHTVAIEEEVD